MQLQTVVKVSSKVKSFDSDIKVLQSKNHKEKDMLRSPKTSLLYKVGAVLAAVFEAV